MTKSGNLFADELTEWLIEEGFYSISLSYVYLFICMHQLLSYLMLMTVSIGILLKLLVNGLLILWEIDSMWTSWDIHIGSCQSEVLRCVSISWQLGGGKTKQFSFCAQLNYEGKNCCLCILVDRGKGDKQHFPLCAQSMTIKTNK